MLLVMWKSGKKETKCHQVSVILFLLRLSQCLISLLHDSYLTFCSCYCRALRFSWGQWLEALCFWDVSMSIGTSTGPSLPFLWTLNLVQTLHLDSNMNWGEVVSQRSKVTVPPQNLFLNREYLCSLDDWPNPNAFPLFTDVCAYGITGVCDACNNREVR